MTARRDQLQVGYVSGLHGVSGWVKIFSYTDPPRNIFSYHPWLLELKSGSQAVNLVDSKVHGAGLIAKFEGINDRDAATPLVGTAIAITRDQLPKPRPDEYYWADLVGLVVITVDGQELGTVKRLIETGANDVMIVSGERERLIPWLLKNVITNVDLDAGRITVDWDPEF